MSKNGALALGLLLALAGGTGCAAQVEDGEPPAGDAPEIEASAQAILNGNWVDPQTLRQGGFVALGDHRPGTATRRLFCSGTLLSNLRVMTARHCFEHSTTEYLLDRPGELQVIMAPGDAQEQKRVAGIIWFPKSNHDYALIDVSAHFTMPRNSDGVLAKTGYSRTIEVVADGTDVVCYGIGHNVETCSPPDSTNCTGTGNGVMRWASLTATVFNAGGFNMYKFKPNILGQLQALGDSGGPCVKWAPVNVQMWKRPLISVLSSCFPTRECNAEMAGFALFDTFEQVAP